MKNIFIILTFFLIGINLSGQCIEKCDPNTITYTATCTGGTGSCTYLWDTSETTQSIDDSTLGVHNHSVTVTDANGCTAVQTASGEILAPFPITIWCRQNNPNTLWATNGICEFCPTQDRTMQLLANPADDNQNCTIEDPNGVIYTPAPNANIFIAASDRVAGIWTYYCEDRNGCPTSQTFEMVEISCECFITPTCGTITNVSCNGGDDGEINVVENGVAPYTYLWSDSQTTNPATGLTAGSYTVTVTDNDGCTGEITCDVVEPTALVVGCTPVDLLCNGDNSGELTVTATGGTPSYDFDIGATSNGTGIFTGLSAGTYNVTVTDFNSCTEEVTCIINEPPVLAATCIAVDATCNGNADGTITVNATGGTPAYTYLWPDNSTANPFVGGAGTYIATVTDSNGCTTTSECTINEPVLLEVTIGCQ